MNRLNRLYQHPWMNRYLKRPMKRYLLPSLVDGLLVVLAFSAALSLRFVGDVPVQYLRRFIPWAPLLALIYVGTNYGWRIYSRLWRYATIRDVVALVAASGSATLVVTASDLLQNGERPFPLSQILLGGLFAFLLMLVARGRYFFLEAVQVGRNAEAQPGRRRGRAVIVGAGDHGQRLARHLQDDPVQKTLYKAVGFIDDDQTKVGLQIHGLKVLGTRQQIPALVIQHAIDQIIIASHTTFGDSFDDLVSICQQTPARIKVLPRFYDLLDQRDRVLNLRDLNIEDVLGREPVQIDHCTCRQALAGRVILVTGAGGSIGSELCRQLVSFDPECLLLVDNNETGLHDLHLELREVQNRERSTRLHSLLADVTDTHKMESIFQDYAPQIVFHAAAYKHVPEMETHPDEAVRVNVLATVALAELAHRAGAEHFIFISTDKAVKPTSVMGASKRIGELWIAARQPASQTRFVSVRFGNVVGSRGSVVPLFSRQIERGGPVTVTDPRMTRYFMSIPEAANLIIQAGAFADRGATYMLDMGQPIRIVELAQKMIRLKGLRPGQDIQIKFIGLRPGEKMREELAYQTERRLATAHPKIYRLEDHLAPKRESLRRQIAALAAASQSGSSPEAMARLCKGIVLMARGDSDGCLEMLPPLAPQAELQQLAAWQASTGLPPMTSRRAPALPLRPIIEAGLSYELEE